MNIPLWARRSALAAGLMMAAGAAQAAWDLTVQHNGPGEGVVTDTLDYRVTLDNTHQLHTDPATGVNMTYTYNPDIVELVGSPAFNNGTGSCTDNTLGTISCPLGEIPHGTDNFTIDFKFYVHGNSFSGDSVAFNPVAKLTAGGGTDATNDEESVNTTILPGTDLGVTLTQTGPDLPTAPGDDNELSSGSLWTHSVAVVNNGPLGTTNARVTIVPSAAGMVWHNWPAGCSVDGENIPGANLICTIPGTFAKDDTHSFTGIQSQAVAVSGSTLTATASITSALPDNNATNNSESSSIAVTPGTDLELQLTASTGTVLAGSPRTVTVTPSYHGEVPDTPIFTITIPAALTVDKNTPPSSPSWGDCAWSGSTLLTCQGWDSNGKSAGSNQSMGPVSFPVTGPTGTHNITGSIISSSAEPTPDPHPNNDDVDVVFSAPTSNVSITKTGPAAPHNIFTVGAKVEYTVVLQASGNVAFYGPLSWTENAPAGLNITEISAPAGWDCNTTPLTCSRTYTSDEPLNTGFGNRVLFTVKATVTESSGGSLVNKACRAAFTHPLGVSQDQSCVYAAPITGNADAGNTDLAVIKTVTTDAENIKAGDWLAYQIEMVNAGPNDADSAKVTDNLINLWTVPDVDLATLGGSFQITSIPTGWTCTADGSAVSTLEYRNSSSVALACTTPTFTSCTPGSDCPFIEFQVRPLGYTNNGDNLNRSNSAVISSTTQELNFDNNTFRVESAIQAKTDFTIAKEVSNGWNDPTEGGITGTELQYTITVSNAGVSGANNVIVTDVLPLNVTYLGTSGSDVPSCTGLDSNAVTTEGNRTLTCTWSTFPRSGDRSFIVRIRPNHAWQGLELTNDVYVNVGAGTQTALEGTTEETNYANNQAQAKAQAGEASIDLQVNKRDTTDPVFVGSNTEYEVIISNFGPSVATNATIYDYLPVKGFSWVGNVRFFETDGTNRGNQITDNIPVCSKTPANEAFGTGGEDKEQPDKLNWLWPMNHNDDDPASEGYNANYVNGKWDTRIASTADIICNVGDLQNGEKVMLVYTMKAEERGVWLNHSLVRSQEHIDRVNDNFTDRIWNNDAIQHRTTVRSVPDVTLEKEASAPKVSLMEPFSYTITVTNNSSVEQLYAPQVRDTLPANMVLTGAPTMAGTLSSGGFACFTPPAAPEVPPAVGNPVSSGDPAFVCALGDGIPASGSVVITVPVRVVDGGAANLSNTAFLHLDTDLEFDSGEPDPVKEDSADVEVVVSSISGYVYHDTDNTGVRGSKPAIPGVTVTLVGTDLYGNTVPAKTAITNASGYYIFDNLAPGTYTVTETHPSGWVDGKDTVGLFGSETGSGSASDDVLSNIELPADTHGVEYNFGELKLLAPGDTDASISGYVYHDANDDGVKDTDEEPIADVVITLTGKNGDVRTTTTDVNGFYEFKGLDPGVEYSITETQPTGWADGKETKGTVHNGDPDGNDKFVFTPVSGGAGEEWNFGERKVVPPPVAVPVDNPLALLALILGMGLLVRWYYSRRQLHV